MKIFYKEEMVDVDIGEVVEYHGSGWRAYACTIYFADGREAQGEIQGDGETFAEESLFEV